MKRVLAGILLLLFAFSVWAQQLTMFGKFDVYKPEQYPFKVNRFEFQKGEKLTDERNLRICEALDNSKVALFGNQFSAESMGLLFGTPSIAASLRGVLDRGGVLFFGPVSWDIIGALPQSMKAFFQAAKASVPEQANYKDISTKDSEQQAEGKLAEGIPAYFSTPNTPGKLLAIRHFGDISKTNWKPLVKDKEGRILAIYNDARKGTIIYSYLFNLVRTTENPFLENILISQYGPLKRSSVRAQKLAATQAVPMDTLDLRKEQILSLNEIRTGNAPKCQTTASIRCENGRMYVHFDCKGGTIPPKAHYTGHDSDIWNDDCVEFLVRDAIKSSSICYHFILNSKNAVYDDKNGNVAWNCKSFHSTVQVLENGWVCDLDFSMEELGIGKHCMVNFAREEQSVPEILSAKVTKSSLTVDTAMIPASLAPEELAQKASASGQGIFRIAQVPTFTRVYADMEAPEGADLKKISFLLPRGDRELAQIALFNYTDTNMLFRLEPEFSPISEMFHFYDVLNWRAVTGQVYGEILAEPNSAGVIAVPAGEVKTFVIAAETDAEPRIYKWSFELVPVNYLADNRKIEVEAEVLPLRLGRDAEMPRVFTFGPYGFSFVHGNLKPYQKLLQDAHVNITMGSSVPFSRAVSLDANGLPKLSDKDEDYLGSEKELSARGLSWYYNYGTVEDYKDAIKKLKLDGYMVTESKGAKLFEEFVAKWATALKKANIDFDRIYVPLRDEPRTEHIPELVAAGKILKKYGFRTCNTMATWSTLDDLKNLAPAITLWLPWEPRVTTRETAQQELDFYRSTGCPLMPYLCSMSGAFEPYQSYYRFRGIRTHLMGQYAFSMWAANSWRGNPYRHADDANIKGSFLVHHGVNGAVGTIRLEAFREAAEDLFYLHLAEKSEKPAAKALIDKASLQTLMEQDSPAATQEWRDKLVRALAQ